ncbi:MAG: nucleotidyltransferase domain-containing protein [Azoarcus sp.]|jgi:predicted nucleotidyltransferase|nr:nucleotidyltransferase domain-containing protein [Azoarcus sp.]
MDESKHANLESGLEQLLESAADCLKGDLVSVALFGSAAEDRLRLRSDVNVLFILERFSQTAMDAFRDSLQFAMASLNVRVMFLLRSELPVAATLFSVKFNDIRARHRILYGPDLLSGLVIDERDLRRRLREELLNLSIRLRERYMAVSLREEQLVNVIANSAGPLRASAAALMRLKGQEVSSPRDALEQLANQMEDAAYVQAVRTISVARETTFLQPGVAGPALLQLSLLAEHLCKTLDEDAQ